MNTKQILFGALSLLAFINPATAIADALLFRNNRRSLFPGSPTTKTHWNSTKDWLSTRA
jgi:hypothetical protein